MSNIELKAIKDLAGMSFYIPNYQRVQLLHRLIEQYCKRSSSFNFLLFDLTQSGFLTLNSLFG